MQRIKGMVAGFVAGAVFAAGVFLLMRDDRAASAPAADIAAINEQLQRLEQAVSRLTAAVAANATGNASSSVVSQAPSREPVHSTSPHTREEVQAIAAADALVDQGLQSGQWTRAQASELHAAIAELDQKEAARVMARISAAINADQLEVELP